MSCELYSVSNVDEFLSHYGTPRHSGRYPWGSGEDPYQHESVFKKQVKEKKASGMTEAEIAKSLNMSTTELRARISVEKEEEIAYKASMCRKLKDKGYSNTEIGRMMGIPDTSVGNYLKPVMQRRENRNVNTANMLEDSLKKSKYIQVGEGVSNDIGVSDTTLKTSLQILKDKGYVVETINVPQASNPRQFTTVKVLCPPGTTKKQLWEERNKIGTVTDYMVDGGDERKAVRPPVSLDSKRIFIRYGDQGGEALDGTIYLRRGVEDISLGNSSYAQVRIAVDGTHYLKGMAMYSDNIPEGYDVAFNTNKKSGTPKEKVFKEMKKTLDENGNTIVDPDNPFGALIKANGQSDYVDVNGKSHQRVINKLREEGDWDDYSKSLSSQFLSKQPKPLVKQQLELSANNRKIEFEDIRKLENPEIKRKFLEEFAENCDSAAVHMKAAALPRQSSKVLLPIPSLKDNECYAPTYSNGESVVLIRYPHGGTFEIPQLVVNNKHKEAKNVIGNAIDAIGINSNVAGRLSGADFDGDTVICIPVNDKVKVKSSKPLKDLQGFDPKIEYPGYPGMKKLEGQAKQTEMGNVSNLITDMTLLGAPSNDIAKAVKHSMVVIDAEKHNLDWKRSYEENNIASLKKKYQGGARAGAVTIVSKAKGRAYIKDRKEGQYYTDPETGKTKLRYIDPDTGEKLYRYTGATYTDAKGNTKYREQETSKMAKAKDAMELVSPYQHPTEMMYANYANTLKSLANQARKDLISTKNSVYSPEARKTYSDEVNSLKAKLNDAKKNAPREKQAQLMANVRISAQMDAHPDLEKDQIKKLRSQSIADARARVGASGKNNKVHISDKEWKAIQSGAITSSFMTDLMKYVDSDELRNRAMPRTESGIPSSKISMIRSMQKSGYTISEISSNLGVSASTVTKYLKKEKRGD